MDERVERCVKLLITLNKINPNIRWALDPNASWTPELAIKFLSILSEGNPEIVSKIYMLE
jgi:L-alanine-DL-glutamate epimerase-like enolase superfamily enzyme